MNVKAACTTSEIDVKAPGVVAGIKGMILKVIKALTFDAEAIFKSKEWPYL